MGDVLALFAMAVITIGGGFAVAYLARSGRRKALENRRDAPRRLRAELRGTDRYIERVNDALSEEDLDSLNERRNP